MSEDNVFQVWEDAVGRPITGFEGQVIGLAEEEYGTKMLCDAIREAAYSGRAKVTPRYIGAILRRWTDEGREQAECAKKTKVLEVG